MTIAPIATLRHRGGACGTMPKSASRQRRVAIVCQPWDAVASQSNNPIVIIAYQLARSLAGDAQIVLYGHRGGIPEYVAHGQTGLLVARGEAEDLAMVIAELLDDPALARAMGEAGRQRAVERFS
jgi:glycosyltransferase involved in cell wall biosynthesis